MTWSPARPARLGRLLAAVLLLGVAVPLAGQAVHQAAAAATPATSAISVESQLLNLTNAARTKAGLAALQSSTTLVAIARGWSAHLAATGALSHDPSVAAKVTGWSSLGENVAKAYSAAQAQSLFMGSPDHRANILDRSYNRVGIGVTRAADGSLWITVDFEQTSGYSPPKPAATPAKKPAMKPAANPAAPGSARAAAATRSNRSLTRGAVPANAGPAVRTPALAGGDATARAARLSAQEVSYAMPVRRPAAATPLEPAAPDSPAALLLLASVAALAVAGAVGTQLVVQRQAGSSLRTNSSS